MRERNALEAALEEAVRTAPGELRRPSSASELCAHVLRAVAAGHNGWSSIGRAVEAWAGRHIHDETLRRVLNKLIAMSLPGEGEYKFLDRSTRERQRGSSARRGASPAP